GLGMQESTSDLLRDNCDEFIYYEDLGEPTALATTINPHLPETKRKAFALLLESLLALRRENKEVLWSSMVKDTMKRKKPSFNETYYGYRTFSELLEDAQREGLLELDTDKRSRTYVVTRFGDESGSAPAEGTAAVKKPRRRRRSGSRRRPTAAGNGAAEPTAEPPAVIHLVVLILPLIVLGVTAYVTGAPIRGYRSLAPQGQEMPFVGAIALLTAAIGLPFFVVATSAPLLQRWFADTDHPAARE